MDIESLKNIKPIDILGLSNFRIFDKQNGFLELFPSISIFTGANNSGKSSIIKALQMLKNSVNGYKYPFSLDLNEQEHLLGDFQNILWDKQDSNLEITLPFLFIGLKNFCISLTFETSKDFDPYYARLREVAIKDTTDMTVVFAFSYREATGEEKTKYAEDFKKEIEEFESKSADSLAEDVVSKKYSYFFKPSENSLSAYVDWRINNKKLKHYLSELAKAYDQYLQNQSQWRGEGLKKLDDIAKDMIIIPSSFISSFKKDPDATNWKAFIDTIDDKQTEITGKEHVGERDFDADEYFIAPPEIETVLFQKISEILKKQVRWKDIDRDNNSYYLIEHFFSSSWEGLIQRIATINYVSNIKEENARSYNAASNSPFVRLLKSYAASGNHTSEFVSRYLEIFEIGKEINVRIDPKHQSILVNVTTLDGMQRDLVDFGYGIKQLILIIMQIGVLSHRNRRDEHIYDNEYGEIMQDTYIPSVLIIEEPESNLHPKWQSKLADMFVEANSKFNIQLIIESHSEYLIRKFQTLVAENKISSGNIKIFYLRNIRSVTDDKKQVESLLIADDGSIDFNIFDHGFFDENYNLHLSLLNIQRDKFLQDFQELKKNHQESEDKVVLLQEKIDAYTDKADVSKYQSLISYRYNTSKLSFKTVEYLVSAEYLLENIDIAGDYSPVIIQYGRAVENELKRIFLQVQSKNWLLGSMEISLKNYFNGSIDYPQLPALLGGMFSAPATLRISLLEDIRKGRNSAAHAGETKTKQEALSYIAGTKRFLDNWIATQR